MSDLEMALRQTLAAVVGDILATSILTGSVQRVQVSLTSLDAAGKERLVHDLERAVRTFVQSKTTLESLITQIASVLHGQVGSGPAVEAQRIAINDEGDIVEARTVGRTMAKQLGFSASVQVKIATAISELARNIVLYAGRGTVELKPVTSGRKGIELIATDNGPGIENLEKILAGDYRSRSGMGLGLRGTKKLTDEMEIDTGPGRGTRIRAVKYL